VPWIKDATARAAGLAWIGGRVRTRLGMFIRRDHAITSCPRCEARVLLIAGSARDLLFMLQPRKSVIHAD